MYINNVKAHTVVVKMKDLSIRLMFGKCSMICEKDEIVFLFFSFLAIKAAFIVIIVRMRFLSVFTAVLI